jgi:hypothetical protein
MVERSDPIKSEMGYELRSQVIRNLSFDTALTEDAQDLILRFDSRGSKNIESMVADLSGRRIRDIRSEMSAERMRLKAILDAMTDAEDQIDRSLS